MSEKEKVKQQFSKSKHHYITSTTHSNPVDLEELIQLINPEKHMVALDVATGGGHMAKYLANKVKTVIASDMTEAMLENTANHLSDIKNINYTIADAENLPFEDNSFDIITCRYAAHHFPHPEQFIKESYRVLKQGGTCLIVDNVGHESQEYDTFINMLDKKRDPSHVRALPINEWKEYLQRIGFSIEREIARKKRLPYKEWVTRTLDDKREIEKVNQHILQAPEQIKHHYEVLIDESEIQSFSLDEWVVVCKK